MSGRAVSWSERIDRALRWCARQGDIFGSDIYLDYPHAYVWQANQFGHILIGLGGTLALGWLVGSAWAAFAAVVLVYASKEAIDILIGTRLTEGVFPPDRGALWADGLVDALLVTCGALVAVAVRPEGGLPQWLGEGQDGWLALGAMLGTVTAFLGARAVYVPQKRRFDRTGMGAYVRLATFPSNFAGSHPGRLGPAGLLAWIADASPGGHLVIAGPPRSGRTTLALSLGAEAAIRLRRRVRYLSASRLMEKAKGPPEDPSKPGQPWQVAEADLVIVDEVGDLTGQGDAAATLALLTATAGGEDVFDRPIPGAAPRRRPRVIWAVSAPLDADGFMAALAARYAGCTAGATELSNRLARTARAARRD